MRLQFLDYRLRGGLGTKCLAQGLCSNQHKRTNNWLGAERELPKSRIGTSTEDNIVEDATVSPNPRPQKVMKPSSFASSGPSSRVIKSPHPKVMKIEPASKVSEV